MTMFNRLVELPPANSREMRAYMQAILEVSGLMSGQAFPLERFMSNYRTHLEPKASFPYPTMQKHSDGTYQLTAEGVRFFSSRLTQAPVVAGQKVSRFEVIEMMRAILAPMPPDRWESIDVALSADA